MKKLLMTMAASVAAIGLTYAEESEGGQGEATVQPTLVEFTDDFEEEENLGASFNTEKTRGDGEGYVIWTTKDAESVVVDSVTDEGGNVADVYLKLETAKDAPLLRTFADYGMPPNDGEDTREVKEIATNLIVDANITFTGFEEHPTPSAEDKILIWMKAVDAEFDDNGLKDGTGVTNLCITAGKLDGDSGSVASSYVDKNTQKTCFYTHIIDLGEEAVVGKEYRVTIKSVGNIDALGAIEGGVLGFEVYIDGKQVKYKAANTQFWGNYGSETDAIDNVFPALIAGTTLKAAGFEGTGTIDDVLVCAADSEDAPSFTQGGGDVVIAPIAPGGESEELDTEADATELAGTINGAADKSQYITVPAGIDKSKNAYLRMFVAVASGKKVSIQLTEDATNALQEVVNNLTTNATTSVAALLSTLASAGVEADDPVLNITGVKPGFWYSIESGAELNGMGEGDRVMADDDGAVTLTVPVIKVEGQKSGKGFYRVLINLKDKVKVPSVE